MSTAPKTIRRVLGTLITVLGLAGCPSKTTVHTPPPPDEASPRIEASLISARSTGESLPAARVTLRFRNLGKVALVVEGYAIEWPGGRFEAEPELRVDAGSEQERTARIDASHGDIGALLQRTDEAEVSVTSLASP